MKVTCPRMGDYSSIIKELGKYVGWEIVMPPKSSDESLQLGIKHMSELMCLPAKLTLGNFIQALEKGTDKLIMFDSCGECRLKTYWILQERALRKFGYDVRVHPVRLGRGTPADLRAVDPSISWWKSWWAFFRILHHVYKLDQKLCSDLPEDTNQVKIGIVGEIFTILEPEANKDLVKKIQKMGALVHNSLPLSYFIFKGLYNRGWMKRKGMDQQALSTARTHAHSYFPKEIGGHGNESIIHTIYYGLKKFDGVIHLLPFPCMPEATVAAIIDDISTDYGIPVMRIIFDVHTAMAGLDTRLEAFVDILQRKKAILKKREEGTTEYSRKNT